MRKTVFRPVWGILTSLAIVFAAGTAHSGGSMLDAETAYRLSKAGKVVLLDVRSPGEWGARTGVPEGAMTVTIHDPAGQAGFLRAVSKAVNGDRNLPLAVICARGNRSAMAREILQNAGFTKVYNVSEGVLGRGGAKGWFSRGLPVEYCVKCRNSVAVKRSTVQ